jgi:hypothetical protein
MQKLGQERQPLMPSISGTSIQQKNKESPLTITQPSYTGLRSQPTCPKLWQLSRSQRNSPTDFCERLCEAFWVYTPFNPQVPENQQMINTAFVAQSYADIRWKLQKLEGFAGMNATQLLEVQTRSL